VPRTRSPARLVIALSIAALLVVFLVYTSLAGGGRPVLRPSQLRAQQGDVFLSGKVIGKVTGDAQAGGLRFRLRDVKGKASVPVLYHGAVPDLFRSGRDVSVTGRLQNGVFIGDRDSLVTKCPSKYTPKR
jgi:cytochrome c-type biogenesis protein CcmE